METCQDSTHQDVTIALAALFRGKMPPREGDRTSAGQFLWPNLRKGVTIYTDIT